MRARVLVIAGSDSGGGAGIQADIKTVTALGGYAMTAITALTAQNTCGVQAVSGVEPAFIREQITSVLSDIGADVIKTGMLHASDVVDVVVNSIDELAADRPVVVDPVMVSQSGHQLVGEAAMQRLASELIPRATLITPNTPEAEALLSVSIRNTDDMVNAAEALLQLGCQAVLLKGGHLGSDPVIDVLASDSGVVSLSQPRIQTTCDHGTGCTLASAIAEGMGRGLPLSDAVNRGRAYLHRALATAQPLGQGHGPVNHGHTVGIMSS